MHLSRIKTLALTADRPHSQDQVSYVCLSGGFILFTAENMRLDFIFSNLLYPVDIKFVREDP